MRELKFRSWVKAEKKMLYVPQDAKNTNKIIMSAWRDQETENSIFTQSVGIIDKNGKEIYEGDIVRDTRSDDTLDVIEWGGYGFIMSEYDEADDIFYCPSEWEVIGNIYENPELVPK